MTMTAIELATGYTAAESQESVSVTDASGNSQTFDCGLMRRFVAITAELEVLSGGSMPTVTFTFEDSPDGTNWYEISEESALATAGAKTQRLTAFHRYLRVSWATTGSPTTATTSFRVSGA
jgi:hypothetical protein